MISILPARSHFITFEKAVEITSRFRSEKENILDPSMRNLDILPISEVFHREAFDSLLNIQDCAGIRIYLGMETDKLIRIVAVAVNSDNEDLITGTSLSTDSDPDEDIIQDAFRCPDICDTTSPLNG